MLHRTHEWQPLVSSNVRSLLKEAREGASLDLFGSFMVGYNTNAVL